MSEKEKKTTVKTTKSSSAVKHTVRAKTTTKSEEHKSAHVSTTSSAPAHEAKKESAPYEKRRGPYGKNTAPKDFQLIRESIEKKIDAFFEANKDAGLRKLVSASKLMEAGAHIGMSAKL
jgi:hypothetical protein